MNSRTLLLNDFVKRMQCKPFYHCNTIETILVSTQPQTQMVLKKQKKNTKQEEEEEARRRSKKKKKQEEEADKEEERRSRRRTKWINNKKCIMINSVDPHELLPGVSHLANPGIYNTTTTTTFTPKVYYFCRALLDVSIAVKLRSITDRI